MAFVSAVPQRRLRAGRQNVPDLSYLAPAASASDVKTSYLAPAAPPAAPAAAPRQNKEHCFFPPKILLKHIFCFVSNSIKVKF